MDNTYNKLLNTGIKLFGEFGYDGVSIRDIVKDSGANLSAVSYHFNGKEGLYNAVVEFLVAEVKTRFTELNAAKFTTLSLTEMEQKLPQLILEVQKLFTSTNGIHRTNLINREFRASGSNLSTAYMHFMNMAKSARDFYTTILGAYYAKRNESPDKIDFIISILANYYRNIPLQQKAPLWTKEKQQDLQQRMLNLILYSKI